MFLGDWEWITDFLEYFLLQFFAKDKVKRLIEKFENHPNKESFFQDFKQIPRVQREIKGADR